MGILMDDFANGRNVTALPSTVSTFDWDTKVQDLLSDEWQLENERTTKTASLRDIFGHMSGMTR